MKSTMKIQKVKDGLLIKGSLFPFEDEGAVVDVPLALMLDVTFGEIPPNTSIEAISGSEGEEVDIPFQGEVEITPNGLGLEVFVVEKYWRWPIELDEYLRLIASVAAGHGCRAERRDISEESKSVVLWKDAEAPSVTVEEVLVGTFEAIETRVDRLMEELASLVHAAADEWRRMVRQQGYL